VIDQKTGGRFPPSDKSGGFHRQFSMNNAHFRRKVLNVADILGYEAECSVSVNRASMSRDDALLFISSSDGRLRISGVYPHSKDGNRGYNLKDVTITVTVEKSATLIAREIERRVLPDYLEELEEATRQVNERNDYTETRGANIQELSDVAGVSIASGFDRDVPAFRFGGDRNYQHQVKCQGKDTIEMKLDSLTVEQARKVITVLKN